MSQFCQSLENIASFPSLAIYKNSSTCSRGGGGGSNNNSNSSALVVLYVFFREATNINPSNLMLVMFWLGRFSLQ